MLAPSPPEWPPNYAAIWKERQVRLLALSRGGPRMVAGAREYYRKRPIEFIEHWCCTVDPRNAGTDKSVKMPFILFPRQRAFVEFFHRCLQAETSMLCEKSRDMGVTWICVCLSAWLFCTQPGATVGWGSRKAMQVDSIGDPSSIFEKLRMTLRGLPAPILPDGFDFDHHMNHMRIISPDGRSVTGESGDDIGRGGRTLVYFKDEAAHYEHPESIEAALNDNTRIQVDISSVNGLGNVFHRRRESGADWDETRGPVKNRVNVFVMDWTDHPEKTQQWYDLRQQRAESEGLLHLFRQEVDRSYSASVEGVIIPAAWVKSAMDAHLQFPDILAGGQSAGLDVADGGGDRNALAARTGVVLDLLQEWGERDTGVTT